MKIKQNKNYKKEKTAVELIHTNKHIKVIHHERQASEQFVEEKNNSRTNQRLTLSSLCIHNGQTSVSNNVCMLFLCVRYCVLLCSVLFGFSLTRSFFAHLSMLRVACETLPVSRLSFLVLRQLLSSKLFFSLQFCFIFGLMRI